MSETRAVGVDLGGTGTRFVALDAADNVIARASVGTPPSFERRGESAKFLIHGIRHVLESGTAGAIGIGASGPIDADGIIRNPDTLPAFTGEGLLGPLRSALGVDVVIDNDAVTAAVYETTVGVAAGRPSALVVTLGTGVGVCAIRDRRPMRGADGTHPEAGHLSISGTEGPCYCGRSACWEQLASRTGLQHAARGLLGDSDVAAVFADAAAGKPAAVQLFQEYGTVIADGLADLLTVERSTCVVLGGSAARYHPAFMPQLTTRLGQLASSFPMPEVLVSDSDEFAGAIGAALLARTEPARPNANT